MSFTKSLLALVMVSAAGLAGSASAATPSSCTADQDCGHGYTCQVSAVDAKTAPACPPNADCPTSGVGTTTPTTTSAPSTCQPGPCTADSDCSAEMVCHTESISSCSGGSTAPPCEAGTKCDPDPTTSTCTTTTSSMCAFRWQLPCSADTDCGAGFVCQPSVYGSCSGGSPVSGGGTGSAGSTGSTATTGSDDSHPVTSPPDMCTTTTAFPGWCHPAVATCGTDADCPANWICQELVTRGTPTPGASSGAGGSSNSGSGSSGSDTPNAGTAEDVATVPATTTTKMCSAPLIAPLDGRGSGDGPAGGSETTGAPNGSGGTNGKTNGVPPSGSASGSGGTTAAHDSSAPGATNDSGGCSVTPRDAHPGTTAAGLLAFGLGLAFVRRRRNRQKPR